MSSVEKKEKILVGGLPRDSQLDANLRSQTKKAKEVIGLNTNELDPACQGRIREKVSQNVDVFIEYFLEEANYVALEEIVSGLSEEDRRLYEEYKEKSTELAQQILNLKKEEFSETLNIELIDKVTELACLEIKAAKWREREVYPEQYGLKLIEAENDINYFLKKYFDELKDNPDELKAVNIKVAERQLTHFLGETKIRLIDKLTYLLGIYKDEDSLAENLAVPENKITIMKKNPLGFSVLKKGKGSKSYVLVTEGMSQEQVYQATVYQFLKQLSFGNQIVSGDIDSLRFADTNASHEMWIKTMAYKVIGFASKLSKSGENFFLGNNSQAYRKIMEENPGTEVLFKNLFLKGFIKKRYKRPASMNILVGDKFDYVERKKRENKSEPAH